MSKCDLRIEIDRDPPHYQPGETLRGEVVIEVNADCPCKALSAQFGWRTHGKGNTDEGEPEKLLLGSFDWQAGQTHRVPFSFLLPRGPVSYHGHLINVDWYVNARADIPWAIDPKAERDVLLLPAPAEREAQEGYRSAPKRVAQPHVLGTGPKSAQSLRVKLFGAAVFVAFIWFFFGDMLFENGQPNWVLFVFFGFALFIFGRMLYKDVRNLASQQKLGDLEIVTKPDVVTRGEAITLHTVLAPKSDLTVNAVSATLVGKEIAVSGSGTRKKTHTHNLCSRRVELGRDLQLAKGERHELTGQLKVPKDAAPTFRADDNDVRWEVVVDVDIKDWPDFEQVREIEVHPS